MDQAIVEGALYFARSRLILLLATLLGSSLLAGCPEESVGGDGSADAAVSDGDVSDASDDADPDSDALTDGGGPDGPCEGVVCELPQPLCVGEATLRTFRGEGRCIAGRCLFDDYSDEDCTDCCYGAEINLTGDPLGGGVGYRDIIDPADATVVVNNAVGLFNALEDAISGDIIYLDDDAEIDLSGEEAIAVPAGVTLASGRGREGSQGGLITCTSYPYPLFTVQGESVRFTGLRLRGPNPDIGDHDYELVVHSGAIRSSHPSLEVDNCELWAWGTSAISLNPGALDSHVHHNYIHHTRRAGLGYGVVLNQAEALIEGNIFDTCRHHIAATGRIGTSYEAAYNLVLEHAHSHYFDMHGARDYDKRETKAIWRFDEGEGDVAEDSSIGYYHTLNHCTLTNMNTGSCWTPGQISTALAFDGIDDHLRCGNDSSLTSEQGTLEFFLNPAALGQTMDIVHLFEDTTSDFLTVQLTAAGRIFVSIEDDGVEEVALTSDSTISADGFHHVAITQDGSEVAIFIDGLPSSTTGINGSYWTDHLALSGSWLGTGPAGFFEGELDEMRIYSRALTPEEITLHTEGNADIAGNRIDIHHNTFRGVDQTAVVIRGMPAEGAWVHHNWFHNANTDRAVRQYNAQGNLDVQDNHYGGSTPLGTILPVANAVVTPSLGITPLAVDYDGSTSFDPLRSIVSHRWDYGDGQIAFGDMTSHELTAPGRYLTRLTVAEENGALMSHLIPVVVTPDGGGYHLNLWVKDSYTGSLTDFYRKQVLVDGQVVWEDDVAGDEGWEHLSLEVTELIDGRERVDVTLRVQNINGVSHEELIELDVFWDDVTLFGATVAGGDFESSAAWNYEEDGTSWSGLIASAEPHSGDASFRISHPYKTACPTGSFAQITQSVPVKSPDLRANWRLDDGATTTEDRSLYANHGVLVDMDIEQCWTQGIMSQALAFDGDDDHIVVTPATSLASAEGSILLWFELATMGSEQTLLELFDEGRHNWLAIRLTEDNRLRVVIVDDDAPVVDTLGGAIEDAEFHHLALIQDGAGVQIYIDGTEVATSGDNGSSWTSHISPTALWLGGGEAGFFSGILDEIEVYSRAFDAAAVGAAYREGFPLAHFSFDEGEGATAGDDTGNDHDGTLTNMETSRCWVSGRVGDALRFDGGDDFVDCADAANLATPEGTIELWLQPAVVDDYLDILNIFEDGYENFLLLRRDANGRVYLLIEDDDSAIVSVSSTVTVGDDSFHHVAVTQNGMGVQIYIDGESSGIQGTNGGGWTDHLALTGLWIGRGHWNFYQGVLDEVRFHPRALRPDEIANLANIP